MHGRGRASRSSRRQAAGGNLERWLDVVAVLPAVQLAREADRPTVSQDQRTVCQWQVSDDLRCPAAGPAICQGRRLGDFQVQEVTETLSKHFNGKLPFVGSGQSPLFGMPYLQGLMGRFPVQVMLGDWDVENGTREIILVKKPTAQPEVEHIWRANPGEISRHRRCTKLEPATSETKT